MCAQRVRKSLGAETTYARDLGAADEIEARRVLTRGLERAGLRDVGSRARDLEVGSDDLLRRAEDHDADLRRSERVGRGSDLGEPVLRRPDATSRRLSRGAACASSAMTG